MPRLDQLLARNLGRSRADARRLMLGHAVSDGSGTVLDEPRMEIAALPMPVYVEAREVMLYDASHVLLNKPAGVVTALSDTRHPVAATLLHDAPLVQELRPIGRLDLDTTGLLLWTTDGGWLQRLTHPRRRVPRTYQAALARPFVAPDGVLILEDGHRPEIEALAPIDAGTLHPSLLRPAGADDFATITIIGGAYHEVRRIFAALGSHVLALCRVSFGNLRLPDDLPPGAWQSAAIDEVWPAATRPVS